MPVTINSGIQWRSEVPGRRA